MLNIVTVALSALLIQDQSLNTDSSPESGDPKRASWNVSEAPKAADGTSRQLKSVPITTTEGTWMSLDVSPDGTTIVFDMLGDIYTMPITGSEDGSKVTRIAAGLQWDMQPVFSPDGKKIAFVSDRSGENGKGGDNIWIMNIDGSDPKQVTKESYRLLTQPIWTPDGRSIIARKHFTSRRSLGAGEMWLYDASGRTDGIQLTAKTSEQKDTGEPALSSDGLSLYYSFDASSGANFEYDKDSNTGIYAINRLNLATQAIDTVVAGPGGACRPVPCPDGEHLAFVRRVRGVSCMFIMNLKSGEVRNVYEGLERDHQETWAVHGVYPAFDWTPDGRSIIFYAKGKIRRLNPADGTCSVIPFKINDTRDVMNAARFAVEVSPEKFDVRVIRHAQVSPDGRFVVFQALGRLYLRDLTSGDLKTVTDETNAFEFYPTWSRDGALLAYVRWNDDTLGEIKLHDLASRTSRTITTEPGHYTDPSFSADGSLLTFVRGGGGYLISPLWSREPGVYVATATPGEEPSMRRIALRGADPHFSRDNARVFMTVRAGNSDSDNASLISVPVIGDRPGDEERTHYRSSWATEFRISPDGKWLAFAERFKVFVTPFMQAGKPIDVGPVSTNVPVVQVSTQAGYGVHWSGDSTRLQWSLGPELFSIEVTDALGRAGLLGPHAVKSDMATEATRTSIGFAAKTDSPSNSKLALTNARILTMDTPAGADISTDRASKVVEQGTILIEGNRIRDVTSNRIVPEGYREVDLQGATVTPGFIDVHAHGAQGENGITPQRNWISHANLAFGVTTIHDPSNDTEMIFAASELAKAGLILSPRTYSTGTILYGATGAFKAEVDSLDDAMFHLSRMKALGAFSVKSYNQPRRDQRQMVMEAARRLGMMVVPEGGALYQHNMTMVVDGHTSVEHTVPVSTLYNDALSLWGATQVGYTPTLGVAYGGLGGENYWYAKTKVWENEHLLSFVPRYIVDPRSRRRQDAPDGEWNHIEQAKIAKALLDAKQRDIIARDRAGGGPTIGAHGQLAGLAAHWEMWMLVQGGMTPFEALRAATIDGAWYVGLDNDLGSITPGKLADLAIFASDPSTDITQTSSISKVMLNGRLYNARTLEELAPGAASAPKHFFHDLQRGASTPLSLEAIMRKAAESGGICEGCGRQHP